MMLVVFLSLKFIRIFFLQQIQEKLLPPSLHIRPRKKAKKSQKLGKDNGGVTQASYENSGIGESQEINNGDKADTTEMESKVDQKASAISSSPYPNVHKTFITHAFEYRYIGIFFSFLYQHLHFSFTVPRFETTFVYDAIKDIKMIRVKSFTGGCRAHCFFVVKLSFFAC